MSTDRRTFKKEFDLRYDAVDIGKYITALRKKQNLSVCQLALRSGLKDPVLLRVEKGEREPRLNTLLKIISGLELSPAKFFQFFDKY
ncbi:MAG: helix-turn-helix domain-containing protein [Candidatus Margulisbacteria bacterium]|jgi:transcriptional regulator with XRE-family HTH domain|nr:helix-turn-helix domain-containing protein [Candidatus Margulisiibacteriota bacterium]